MSWMPRRPPESWRLYEDDDYDARALPGHEKAVRYHGPQVFASAEDSCSSGNSTEEDA